MVKSAWRIRSVVLNQYQRSVWRTDGRTDEQTRHLYACLSRSSIAERDKKNGDETHFLTFASQYGQNGERYDLGDVSHWMAANRLKLNAEKTELLWAGSKYSAEAGSSGLSVQFGTEDNL